MSHAEGWLQQTNKTENHMLFLRLKTTTSRRLIFNQVTIKIQRTTFCQFWDGTSLQSFSVHGGLWQRPQALSALVGLSGVDSDSTDDCSSGSSSSLSLQKKKQKQILVHTTHSVSILRIAWLANKRKLSQEFILLEQVSSCGWVKYSSIHH